MNCIMGAGTLLLPHDNMNVKLESCMFGFYRVAAAVPEIKVADVDFNTDKIVELIHEADSNNATAVLFPELSITGYTCADLFHQPVLVDEASAALIKIAQNTCDCDVVSVVGSPLFYRNSLYNCAVVIQRGKILGVVPKVFNPNYREFYDKRWFASWGNKDNDQIRIGDVEVPFGTDIIFEADRYFKLAIELCEEPNALLAIPIISVSINAVYT